MCSEELKELVYLAIEPNEFDNHKRHVIYKRAKKEGASKEEVDSLIFYRPCQETSYHPNHNG